MTVTVYILDIFRLTASKLRYELRDGESLLYAFCCEDSFDALQKILRFCYYRESALRTMFYDEFLRLKTSENIHYVSQFSRVENKLALNFYI